MQIPIFPLPIFLLPGGVTRLRIFEQRYINMIKNCQQTKGFAISINQSTKKQHWASWVELIDFELGDDGILIVDVRCHQLLSINSRSVQEDGLIVAEVCSHPHWQPLGRNEKTAELTSQLQMFFRKNEDLSSLYKDNFIDDPNWVCARWLELLPINNTAKECFIDENSAIEALDFLNMVILEKQSEIELPIN